MTITKTQGRCCFGQHSPCTHETPSLCLPGNGSPEPRVAEQTTNRRDIQSTLLLGGNSE